MAKAKAKVIEGFDGQEVEVPFEVKELRNLQLPVLKMELEKPVYVRINDAMVISETAEIKENKRGEESHGGTKKKQMEPATVVHCDNLVNKLQYTLICSAVIKSNLAKAYKDDGYVGKCFKIVRHGKRAGKSYFDYTLVEIADPGKK